jgi:hypothetical protein
VSIQFTASYDVCGDSRQHVQGMHLKENLFAHGCFNLCNRHVGVTHLTEKLLRTPLVQNVKKCKAR